MFKLKLRDLRLVVALAESGSLAAVGRRLNLTPSAASHHLKGLERKLGLSLVERSGGRLTLTRAGNVLCAHARLVLGSVAEVEKLGLGVRATRRVRITAPCATIGWFWSEVAGVVERQLENTLLEVVAVSGEELERSLWSGEVDLVLTPSALRDPSWRRVGVARAEQVVVAARTHDWALRDVVDADDFTTVTLLRHHTPRDRPLAQLYGLPFVVEPDRVRVVGYSDLMLAMVETGNGIAIVPRWIAAPWVSKGSVVARRFASGIVRRDWSLFAPTTGLADEDMLRVAHALRAAMKRAAASIRLPSVDRRARRPAAPMTRAATDSAGEGGEPRRRG